VTALLEEMAEIRRQIGERFPNFYPVADVCNRLFVVSAPVSLAPDIRAKVVRLTPRVEKINKCLLTVTKTQLSRVGNVILVAGTKAKARAIYHLLRLNLAQRERRGQDVPVQFKISTLCVDSEAAREILRCYDEERPAAPLPSSRKVKRRS
jgi:hypothetical protein